MWFFFFDNLWRKLKISICEAITQLKSILILTRISYCFIGIKLTQFRSLTFDRIFWSLFHFFKDESAEKIYKSEHYRLNFPHFCWTCLRHHLDSYVSLLKPYLMIYVLWFNPMLKHKSAQRHSYTFCCTPSSINCHALQ